MTLRNPWSLAIARLLFIVSTIILDRMYPNKVGCYEIKSKLGHGGMATVYRAFDSMFGREAAIKILNCQPKFDLKWVSGGELLVYIQGKCAFKSVNDRRELGTDRKTLRYDIQIEKIGTNTIFNPIKLPLHYLQTLAPIQNLG